MQCQAHSSRTGERCRKHAMQGKTVCEVHGAKGGRPVIHGRYSKSLENHPDVLRYYEMAKQDPGLGETLNEIAFLRGKLQHWLESFGSAKDQHAMQVIREYAESITKLVERRHKMLYGEQVTVTMRHYEALVAQFLDLVREIYGDNDQYTTFLDRASKLVSVEANRES